MLFYQWRTDGCLSYLVGCERTRGCAIIDPTGDPGRFLSYLEEVGGRLLYIVDTHTHADHLSVAPALQAATRAPIVMHQAHVEQWRRGAEAPDVHGIAGILAANAGVRVDIAATGGMYLEVGDIRLEILHTPGHTRDSVCLRLRDRIFTGDTLLIGHCGRTDLPGGDPQQLYTSLQQLKSLDHNLVIYPAHDYRGQINSSLGYEKVNNPCLHKESAEDLALYLASLGPPPSAGGKLQCHLTPVASDTVERAGSTGAGSTATPLMAEMCLAMEGFLANFPHDWNLITATELHRRLDGGGPLAVLDVREDDEWREGHINGAVHIPLRQLPRRVQELPADRGFPIVTVCRSGARSAYAALFLRAYGYSDVRSLDFGLEDWKRAGFPWVR